MKKVLLFAIFSFLINGVFGQTSTPGVTVIVHGFDALGGTKFDGIETWENHAISLREYAERKTGKSATVFKNNKNTGFWEIWEKYSDKNRKSEKSTFDSSGEMIFLYDWTNLSNDGMSDISGESTGLGSLESAADNLFAMLIKPICADSKNKAKPIYSPTIHQLLLDKQTHFIGHSRGTVVLLQVLNRLRKYFPDVYIEHLTTLDPHPATKMGDVETTGSGSLNIVTQSLPYIFGSATGCNQITKVCGTDNLITYKIPENVLAADNYYRKGSRYEPFVDWFKIGEFSGISISGASHNRELNNTIMTNKASPFGGAHSEVHNWYWGTFDESLPDTLINDKREIIQYKKIERKNTDWYTNAVGASWFEGSRSSTGFYYSRLADHYNLLPGVTGTPVNNSTKRKIKTPFNGDLSSFNSDYFTGWGFNGGKTDKVSFANGVAKFLQGGVLKHSYFFIPNEATKLRIKARYRIPSVKMTVKIRTDVSDTPPQIETQRVINDPNFSFVKDIEIPANLKNIVGQLEISAPNFYQTDVDALFEIDEIYFVDGSGTQLRTAAIDKLLNSGSDATSYFDFPVNYDVSPTPLIRGIKPNSFKATITNTLSSIWAGTLTMTWRKVTDSGKGIPLVSKGVNLAPNATVTLDRGTQQIISESGEYVLAIYANNDTDPIDRYYFYVEDEPVIVNQSISVTPSTSNYTFGDVRINTTKSQTFTIKNTSITSVNISNYVLTGTGFTQGTTTCCGTLAPNQSYDVSVNFLPNAPSAFNGQLQINGTFTDAPINIALSGVGVYTTPPSTGCLESSLASVNIQSGNTDALKQQFFTLTNNSLTGSVNVTGIGFTGADASYFSYDGNLFSVPSSLNPSFTTGFLVKFNNPQNTTRTYNANLVLTTNNTSCPTLSIPVSATHTPSTITWVSPLQDQTYEVDATSPYDMPLQWQGILPQNVSLDIQYTLDGGQTWTSKIDSQGQTCTIGNDNSGVNTVYFPIDQYAGKDIQFRIKPCYENVTPWKYSGICHIIQVGQPTIQMISPNGYEVLAGGSTVDLKWRNLIGYQSVSLSYTTNNGVSWQTIASNLSGQATYYRWLVPTGVKSSECRIKITAANVSDESDNKFTIQPALATPITYANLVIKPEGCGTTSVGGASFQLLGGTPPYYVAWIEAGIGDNTINASYVTTSVTGLRAGTNRCVVTDANYNKVLYTFDIPQKGIYNYTTYVTKAVCNGANGTIDIRTTGDFQFQNNAILSKDGTTVASNFIPYFTGLTTGIYNLTLTNYDGCQQSTSLFVNATPGTLYTVTPTITNTSCGSTTGAISLNVGNAQSPTYLWSNGATTQNITGLAAGQYSVNVTDATGCVQTVRNEVVEIGGVVENRIGTSQPYDIYNDFVLYENKVFFSDSYNNPTGYSRLGILDVSNNSFDFIQFQSLYFPTRKGVAPNQIEVTSTDIYVNLKEDKPDGRTETHFLRIDKATKQILSRIIVLFPLSGTYQHLKMIFLNGKLYALRNDSKIDVVDFSSNSIITVTLTGSFNNFIKDNSLNKLYLTGVGGVAEFDLGTNSTSRTAPIQVVGNMISQIGSELYIVGEISGDVNTYIEKFNINSFSSIQKYLLKNVKYFGTGRSNVKDNRYIYVPTYGNRSILIFDITNQQVSELPSNYPIFEVAYSNTLDKIFFNGLNSGIYQIESKKFDYTTAKTDASCGLNNGSITLTIPSDGKTYTYLWSNGATTKDVTGLSSGSYTVTVTQTGGCALKKTIVIAQLSTGITATLSPNSGILCPSQTITLQSTAGSSYVWYKDNVVISGATSQSYSVSLAGVYKVVVTNSGGCSATSNNSTITTIPSPTANFTNVVSGNVVTFTNTSINGNQYLWNFGDATTDTQFSPIKTYSGGGGTFTVTLRVTNSCGVYNDVSISVTVSCTSMYTLKTGNWNDITVWSCGRVPTSTDIITVKANHFITIPASYTANAKNVVFETGGKIIEAANTSKLCLSCPQIPTNGLIAYYPLNGNANDASGNSLNGSIVGSITSITDRKGVANSAYQLSGVVLNYISIPDNALLCSNIITLNAWVNFAPTEGGYIINKGRDIQNGSYRLGTGGVAGQVLYNGVNDASYASVPTNQWVMVTGIVSGNSAKYYINGVMVSQATLSGSFVCSSAGNPLTIGNHYYNGVPNIWAYPYKGKIDDVRIYNRALSDAEVLNIYNAEKP